MQMTRLLEQDQDSPTGAAGDSSQGGSSLNETELYSALQLLVERAQYITGATGTALALPQGQEMVCRASAGSSAPAVGARLQVRSGLTGESIARRQLLRCDNAESDPRVNLEACRALGIASIVVLPLMRRNGEVRGLFELFSDHPYAFEERDLIALERMSDLTLTALDLAEQRQNVAPAAVPRRVPEKPAEPDTAETMPQAAAIPMDAPITISPTPSPADSPAEESAQASVVPEAVPLGISSSAAVAEQLPGAAPLPEAMHRVQKCASCGFPISEGRTLCLDCEKKDSEKEQPGQEPEIDQRRDEPHELKENAECDLVAALSAPVEEEFVPAFLSKPGPVRESWLANPVNLLALLVLIVGILLAIVVFR